MSRRRFITFVSVALAAVGGCAGVLGLEGDPYVAGNADAGEAGRDFTVDADLANPKSPSDVDAANTPPDGTADIGAPSDAVTDAPRDAQDATPLADARDDAQDASPASDSSACVESGEACILPDGATSTCGVVFSSATGMFQPECIP